MTSPTLKILNFLTNNLSTIKPKLRKKKCLEFIRSSHLQAKSNRTETRYVISYKRSLRVPGELWRLLANVVIGFDDENFPKLIARGVPEVYQVPSKELSEILLEKSQIEEVIIGTVCWLYFEIDKNDWSLGTKRMIETSTTAIRSGTKSLRECFSDCLNAQIKEKKLTEREFFENLNLDYCYGFVLYHKDLHLYNLNGISCQLKHVSTFDREGNPIEADIGIPHPKVLITEDLEGDERREAIRNLCVESASSTSAFNNGELKPEMNGFIIRILNSEFPFNAIVKSPLYNFIEGYINDVSSARSIVIDAYFKSVSLRKKFTKIFSGLEPIFVEVNEKFNALCEIVYKKYMMGVILNGKKNYLSGIITHIRKSRMRVRSLEDMRKAVRVILDNDQEILKMVKFKCL